MKRFVFIGDMAVPYQVKLCYALQRFYDAEFWFHVRTDPARPAWWLTELGPRCRIFERVHFVESRRYLALDVVSQLRRFDPDVVMLGGLTMPTNAVAYAWAKAHRRKAIFFTEVSRDRRGELRGGRLFSLALRALYRDVDAIFTSSEEARRQFGDRFGFGDRVVTAQYPSDIDGYFDHPVRTAKPAYTYLFPNRLVPIYNPLLAIDVFKTVLERHPGSTMWLNPAGELRDACVQRAPGLFDAGAIGFLPEPKRWDDLPELYRRCDLLLLPATFSAGNFTIIEGMASGMGIVISDKIFGSGKLIRDGENGFARAPTHAAFLDAVERYIAEPSLLAAHASINRPLARRYSIAATAELLHELVESRVLSSPRR